MNEFQERLAVWSGMIGSLLFLAVFVAQGHRRADEFRPMWQSSTVSLLWAGQPGPLRDSMVLRPC